MGVMLLRHRRSPLPSVAGLTVLVTGAASGMGRIYASRAVGEGAARLIAVDVNADGLTRVAQELVGSGQTKIDTVSLDLTDADALLDWANGLQQVPDVLINNAGIVRGKLFWEHDPHRDILATIGVNTLAPILLTRALLPGMIARGSQARILNIASAAGLLSNPRMSMYVASKWSLVGWSDSVRLELQRSGNGHVAVTTACPSYVDTGMFAGVRPPLLTPILSAQHITGRVWAAMLAGKPMVMAPGTVRLSTAIRGILPLRAWDAVAGKLFGVYRSMDHFTGRGTQQS